MDFSKYTKGTGACDSCEYYDEEDECCSLSLDEDEAAEFLSGRLRECKYYKYYDEYKSVQKQI